MNPIVVIGAGGSGKWIATDVKLAAIEHRNRQLLRTHGEAARERPDWDTVPPEIRILTVDVADTETQPVRRQDAFHDTFALDYSEASSEFSDISSEYGKVIESLARGRPQDYPRIAAWLSRKDATCYDLRRIGPSAKGGAGQLRQLGRASLFLSLQGKQQLAGRISEAIQSVARERRGGARVTIFVCGSLAGGTGSGILWDIAALVHHYADSVLRGSYDLIGCIVLPGAFSAVTRKGTVEPVRMAANTYAGLREISRLMGANGSTTFAYNANLQVTLDVPLFTIAYLVEGSRPAGYDLAGDEPKYGTYPTVADAIFLHSAVTVDLRQVRAQMMQQPAGVFSTIGAVQWIFPAEEIILEGGHLLARLSIEALRGGRAGDESAEHDARTQAASEAIDVRDRFFESTSNESSALIRFVKSFLTQARKPQLLTGAMAQLMWFNDKDRDQNLPTLDLPQSVEVANIGSRGDPAGVRQQAENLVAKTLGGRDDELDAGRKTVHAVLNRYQHLHERCFTNFLEATLVGCLNSAGAGGQFTARPGGLLRAEAVLSTIRETLQRFRDLFVEVYSEQCRVAGTNTTVLERANEELAKATKQMLLDEGAFKDRLNNRGEQTDYIRLKQWVHDLLVQDLVHSTIVDIVDRWIRAVGDAVGDVNRWQATLRDDAAALDERLRQVQQRRREATKVRSRRYLSEPGDGVEAALLREQLGNVDSDLVNAGAVRASLAPMSWQWSDGEVVLLVPDPHGRGDRVMWRAHGLPELVRRCMRTFEPIRSMTIWEAFKRAGYSTVNFRAELAGRCAPITVVDIEEQQRYPSAELVPKDYVLAAWEEAPTDDPADSPRRFSQDIREELGNEAISWDDPHVLLAVSQRHLVKLDALNCASRLKVDYERILTGRQPVEGTERRLPLHLFPGESLAAELELTSIDLLNEVVVIPPELVALLEDEVGLLNFALAIAYGHVQGARNKHTAEFSWVAEGATLEDGRQADVPFGEDVSTACGAFLRPGTQVQRQGKVSVISALKHSVDAFASIDDYAFDLRGRARQQLVPDQDPLEVTVRTGFDRVLRMLIRRRADQLVPPGS